MGFNSAFKGLRDHLGNLGAEGRIILKWSVKKYDDDVKQIRLAEERAEGVPV